MKILIGESKSVLATLPSESVNTIITSPPHCGKCGREMAAKVVGAETVTVFRFNGIDGTPFILAPAYDRKTGKRNFAVVWKCPKYYFEWKWLRVSNGHDRYCDEKIITLPDNFTETCSQKPSEKQK